MELVPIGERIIVEIEVIEEKSASGLVIPDSAKETPQTGKVVAVGSKVTELVVGDEVIFFPGVGNPVKGFDNYRLMNLDFIVAVVR